LGRGGHGRVDAAGSEVEIGEGEAFLELVGHGNRIERSAVEKGRMQKGRSRVTASPNLVNRDPD
jgi:hypothetical protein